MPLPAVEGWREASSGEDLGEAFNIPRFSSSQTPFIPSFTHSYASIITVALSFSHESTQFPAKNHKKPTKKVCVKMTITGVTTHETRAQTLENWVFSRGKLSGKRCLSQLTVMAFHSINIRISLQISMIRLLLTYLTLQFQL